MKLEDMVFAPTVSVIVPVWNGERTIRDLLESLLQIDYDKEKLEVIVVDGNSTDKTRDIVAEYPVKLIVEKRRGLNVARNTGVKASSGEIVAFTDADCVVPKEWVRKLVRNFQDPDVGCVGGTVKGYGSDFTSIYGDNSVMPVMRLFRQREKLDMVKLFLRYPAGCNMAFRREAILKAGGFDENIHFSCDEVEFVERVCQAGYKMILDPEVLILHKHRTTVKGILKQAFQYGRGSGNLLKKKKAKDILSFWSLLSLISFFAWITIASSLMFLTITTRLQIVLMLFLAFIFAPLIGLIILYTRRALKNKRYKAILIYPFIDILRVFAFCIGEIYQLIRREK